VWTIDLVTIHIPDFRPAPRLFQELSGNIPKCVALDYRVHGWRIFCQKQRIVFISMAFVSWCGGVCSILRWRGINLSRRNDSKADEKDARNFFHCCGVPHATGR